MKGRQRAFPKKWLLLHLPVSGFKPKSIFMGGDRHYGLQVSVTRSQRRYVGEIEGFEKGGKPVIDCRELGLSPNENRQIKGFWAS